jgi:hypothetical protein
MNVVIRADLFSEPVSFKCCLTTRYTIVGCPGLPESVTNKSHDPSFHIAVSNALYPSIIETRCRKRDYSFLISFPKTLIVLSLRLTVLFELNKF